MDTLPSLITDLALILIVAGVVTIVFKRLKQPLVLGYIVAGFLTGPNMPYMPTVQSIESVDLWGQIGVIFLMFSLGLEFSFKKLLKMGFAPVLSACVIMMCMMGLGCGIGFIFGWSTMNLLFLGGMLSMSSTTIIYKAFNDLGLANKRFASSVLSVLILEDIFGIIIMVVLATLSSKTMESSELMMSMIKLVFFMALWFLVGLWLIPMFLRKNRKYINNETLLIVSLGLCFLMVVIASKLGYSPALGAFVMGSMLAETIEAEKIENAVIPVKDLFGAIFFVSVGMLVSPTVLAQYWYIIIILVIAVMVGQMVFGTIGFLLSSSSLRDAMQSGFSMVQIGEFSFIIANLGVKLDVIDSFISPVIVAVSIITTFFTPYCIKLAAPAYAYLGREINTEKSSLPDYFRRQKGAKEQAWRDLLRQILLQTSAYTILCVAILALLFVSVLLLCRQLFGHWPGNAVCGVLTLMLLSLFIRPIVMKKVHSIEAKFLWNQGFVHRVFLLLLTLLRFTLGCVIIYYVLNFLSPYRWYWHILVSILLMLCMLWSRVVKYLSVRLERTFVQNIRMREHVRRRNEKEKSPSYARQLRGRDLHIARLKLPSASMWAGSTLAQLRIGVREQVHVVAIVRDEERINIPGGRVMLFPNDIIEVLGDDESIELFCQHMATDVQAPPLEGHEEMQLHRIIIGPQSPLIGLFIKQSGIRDDYHCMVVGFEDSEGNLTIANADRVINSGDTMWIVGEMSDVLRLKTRI